MSTNYLKYQILITTIKKTVTTVTSMERLSSTTSGKFDTSEKMDNKESVATLPESVSTMPYTYMQIARL